MDDTAVVVSENVAMLKEVPHLMESVLVTDQVEHGLCLAREKNATKLVVDVSSVDRNFLCGLAYDLFGHNLMKMSLIFLDPDISEVGAKAVELLRDVA